MLAAITRPFPLWAVAVSLAAWAVAKLLRMPPDLMAGMVLAGSVANGTASNVMIYLSRAATCAACWPASCRSSGCRSRSGSSSTASRAASCAAGGVEPMLPLVSMVSMVSMVSILAIIAAVVGGTHQGIAAVGPVVALGVVLHNGIGLLGGYWSGRLPGFDESVCRTLAIDAGMQHSGLAATLGKAVLVAARRAAGRAVLGMAQPCPARCWPASAAGVRRGRPARGVRQRARRGRGRGGAGGRAAPSGSARGRGPARRSGAMTVIARLVVDA